VSEKEPIKVVESQPVPMQGPPAELQKTLNKVSVKFNVKSMLDQETGEAMSDFINVAVQTVSALKAKVAELEKEIKASKEAKA